MQVIVRACVALLICFSASLNAFSADFLSFAPPKDQDNGKNVVLISGDEEYRSEESMPMLAKILAERHGFRTTVLFSLDDDGTINPTNQRSLSHPEALDSADAIVILTRFRNWPDETLLKFKNAMTRGVPVVALRTSTHAFSGIKGSHADLNNWGKRVLGEEWVSHWGKHKAEATLGIIEPSAKENPILNAVSDIFCDTDVYEAHPPQDANILVRGQVLSGMTKDSPPANYSKKRATDKKEQSVNDPMMPVAWTRELKLGDGQTQRIFVTTMGSATDLLNVGLRRMVVNAVYWGLNMDVPKEADVTFVGPYNPTDYGFGGYQKKKTPDDYSSTSTKMRSARVQDGTFQFEPHQRIAFVGNGLAERMNLFGHFETLLQTHFANDELVIRNFARPADEVGLRQRPNDYEKIDDPLAVFAPDAFLCFFGFNESFAGPGGIEKFKSDYKNYLNELTKKYSKDGVAPQFVLVSPIAFEDTNNRNLPASAPINENLKLYSDAIRDFAASQNLPFVDLFTPTSKLFSREPGLQYTINGAHLNEAGDLEVGRLLFHALVPIRSQIPINDQLRAAINDKSWVNLQDYRMLNGWYVYGGRRTWDTETFPLEYNKIRNMAAVRDRYVWDIAQGKHVADVPDDSNTGELFVPQTRFGEPRQQYSEDQEAGPRILSPDEFIKTCTVPPGFEIKLFADETKFPEIGNPVQISFDSKGRLWVSCMPGYPQWKPGDPKPSDKLVILEDTDHDGQADKSTVFYDKLHCPTGFEFFDGGVLVTDQPRLIFLKDTDGDDVADEVLNMFDGFATEDTHHTIGAFEMSPSGKLHMLEGVAMSTAVETPWGPFRNFGSSGVYVLDPRTWKISHFNTPGYGNGWCYVFNNWGQGICGDGTGASQHWDTPLSGKQYGGRKGLNAVFDTERMRPVVGSEYLVSRQFPDDVQGQFIYACVINTNGMPRWDISDDGAGYKGTRVRHDPKDPKTAFDLIKSTDKHFRPVDPKIGPDGALWFGDWANPLIGHMQYSQRDPNRDHLHGRIYRLVYQPKELLDPITQADKSIEELFDQLSVYEWRMRYTIRREIQSRPEKDALATAASWLAKQDASKSDYELKCLEVLWTQQSFHQLDMELLKKMLSATQFDARAAATRIIADERGEVPNSLALLKAAALDEHPRVRTEAVRGLSFFGSTDALAVALDSMDVIPKDYYVNYTAGAALGANLGEWRSEFLKGNFGTDNKEHVAVLNEIISTDQKGAKAVPYLQILLGREQQPEEARNKAIQALSDIGSGDVNNGRSVFTRNCNACHSVENGPTFGPAMAEVGKRLTRFKIVESVIDPNAEVAEKYLSTLVVTEDGKQYTGLLVEETPEHVVIFDGKEKRTIKTAEILERAQLRQSSMPEGLAASIAPSEFLDLIEFLSSLK